jgi:lipoprotein-releasing system permease protein
VANVPLYIAKRYLLAKKGSTAVTIITWLAVSAMTIAVAAMFIIVSVFSGLEDMNKDLISNLHADLTIKSDSHKNLKNISKIDKVLKQENQIAHYSKIIEEKVYIDYKGKGDVGFLRGVDSFLFRKLL